MRLKMTPKLQMTLRSHMVVAMVLVSLVASSALAQAKQSPSRGELEAEIKRLRATLDECRSANASKRGEAIASLRAVRSALGTGANLEEFKRYQIDSRIKVDALPVTPENAAIREVSELYADAVKFRIIYATEGAIESTSLASAKARYAHDESIMKALNEMKSEDVVQALEAKPIQRPSDRAPRSQRERELLEEMARTIRETQEQETRIMRNTARKINAESARHISALLLLYAEKALLELK